MSMVNKNTFFLRKATREDLDLLLAWANDHEVRRNSFPPAMISYEEHAARFDRLMKKPNSTQYILTVKGQDAGQIRITVYGERAEIDYSIAPKYRCMGYGKMIISLLPKAVKEDFPKVKTLAAQVKADNIASRKAFMDNHYEEKNLVYELDIDMENEDKKAAAIHDDAEDSTERVAFAAAVASIDCYRKYHVEGYQKKIGEKAQKGWKAIAVKTGIRMRLSIACGIWRKKCLEYLTKLIKVKSISLQK